MKKLSSITAAVSGVLTTGVLIAAADISVVVSLIAGAATAGAALFALPTSSNKKKMVITHTPLKGRIEDYSADGQISRLRTLATQIVTPEIRKRLERIIVLAERMIAEVEKDPRDRSQLRSFYNHYLPSTVTIVAKYLELSTKRELSGQGREALLKSEQTLVSVETAFEKQLSNLLDNDILDLDVEVDVLEQSLRMDGLITKNERNTHDK